MIDPPRPVFDIVVHEQDIRGALGVPGPATAWGCGGSSTPGYGGSASSIDEAELPALEIAMEDEGYVAGSGDVSRPMGRRALRAVPLASGRSAEQLSASGCPLVYLKQVPFLRWPPPTSSNGCSLRRSAPEGAASTVVERTREAESSAARGVDGSSLAGPVLVLQQPLVELAGRVAGQLVAEVDRARALRRRPGVRGSTRSARARARAPASAHRRPAARPP